MSIALRSYTATCLPLPFCPGRFEARLGVATGCGPVHAPGVGNRATPRDQHPAARALVAEYVPLDSIRGATRNPRKHDIPLLCRLIRRFGFVALPTLDANTGQLVAGHGRTLALRSMRDSGEIPPKGVLAGWMVPVRRVAFESATEAEAYVLADNRASESSVWVYDELRAVLEDLAEADAAADLGWSNATLAAVLLDEPPPERDEEPEERTKTLTITFERDAFARLLPRLAAAQQRHRTTTYAQTLEALLETSEDAPPRAQHPPAPCNCEPCRTARGGTYVASELKPRTQSA